MLVKIHPSTNMSWGISCAFSDTAAARLYSGGRISAENMLDIDRKSVVLGKRVDLCSRRIIKLNKEPECLSAYAMHSQTPPPRGHTAVVGFLQRIHWRSDILDVLGQTQ